MRSVATFTSEARPSHIADKPHTPSQGSKSPVKDEEIVDCAMKRIRDFMQEPLDPTVAILVAPDAYTESEEARLALLRSVVDKIQSLFHPFD